MRLDPARFAAAYAVLWAAGDFADHGVQTDAQAAGKATSWRAMAGHVAGYGATQALALGALHGAGVRLRPGRVLAGLAVSLGTHAFFDRRWPVFELLDRTGSGRFARPRVVVHHEVDGDGKPIVMQGVPRDVEAHGPLPLHGPYLTDQACHHVCTVLAAAIIGSGR